MKKLILLAIFIAFSNLSYSQIKLSDPSSGEKLSMEREEAKKYSIEIIKIDSLKKYTVIVINKQYELGKKYDVINVKEYKILDSLELTKDKPIEINVNEIDENDEIQTQSQWTINLKKKDLSYKESVKVIMDSIDFEEKKSRIVGHLKVLNNKDGLDIILNEKDQQGERKLLNDKFIPDTIVLKIRRGSIKDIRVSGEINNKKVVFGKENRSIDIFKINNESQGFIKSFNDNRYLELQYPITEEPQYFKLSKILGYEYKMGKKFFPKDTIIPIKINSKSTGELIPLYKDVHLNSYLEGRLYTDIIGLNGEEANGVAQAEIKAHFNLNTQSNFAYVEPSLHYSKFTKDNDFVVLEEDQSTSKALTNFHRQSFLNVGLKINIIKWEFGDRYDLDAFNIGSQYSWTRLKEITSTTDITNTVHLFNSFIEVKGKMNEFNNFGISLGNKFLYELPVQDQDLDLDPFSWYIIPELEIFYYPVENKNNTIYLRFTYTSNTRNHDFDYPSLQFGYKFRIKLNQK
ncbi:hypothetical protein [Lacinutrix cladophorae]